MWISGVSVISRWFARLDALTASIFSGSFLGNRHMPLSLLILIATVQGLTEFLPVSSSGHLVLIPIITNFAYQGRLIDVAAHVGTLIAVAFYLRVEIIAIIMCPFSLWAQRSSQRTPWHTACAGYNSSCYCRLFCELRGLALVRYGANTGHRQFWICHHFVAQRYSTYKKARA